jgi:hypothetical protein
MSFSDTETDVRSKKIGKIMGEMGHERNNVASDGN